MGDIDYIVDLCDEVLGSLASRQHVFPWLRDDDGAEAPVTAYYGDRQLAIEVLNESEDVRELDEGLRHRFATLLARGIQPGLLVTGMLAHDETGALRRRREEDREVLASTLESLVDEGLRREFNVKLGLVDGWASYEGSYATFDADDGDWDDDGDDEWEEADDDERVSGVPQLGWRSRPIAQAILGGAVLARRAFGARYAGEHRSLDLQLLAALVLSEDGGHGGDGEDIGALSSALAAADYDVRQSVERLQLMQLIEERGFAEDGDDRIGITETGGEAVEAWLSRAAVLFPRWPPDQHDVDDATGST